RRMLIPVFGSCPTHLNDEQEASKRLILGALGHVGCEWRSVGQTDYPIEFPLREVLMLARNCAGGVVLGFSQFQAKGGTSKSGTAYEAITKGVIAFATP